MSLRISIPFSTIKSASASANQRRKALFQFHLVRLKARRRGGLPYGDGISIPFSTIKRRYGHR